MEIYADINYYTDTYGGTTLTDDKYLKKASRHIDALTYNRIVGKGINALTPFQQEVIKEVTCELAEFESENKELIESVLQSYSINGVSMTFGNSWNIAVISGIAIKKDIYERLVTTGLCCRVLRS